jgi:hypothetical protein
VQQYFVLKKYKKQFEELLKIRNNNNILFQIKLLENEIKNNLDKIDFINEQKRKISVLKLDLTVDILSALKGRDSSFEPFMSERVIGLFGTMRY